MSTLNCSYMLYQIECGEHNRLLCEGNDSLKDEIK